MRVEAGCFYEKQVPSYRGSDVNVNVNTDKWLVMSQLKGDPLRNNPARLG